MNILLTESQFKNLLRESLEEANHSLVQDIPSYMATLNSAGLNLFKDDKLARRYLSTFKGSDPAWNDRNSRRQVNNLSKIDLSSGEINGININDLQSLSNPEVNRIVNLKARLRMHLYPFEPANSEAQEIIDCIVDKTAPFGITGNRYSEALSSDVSQEKGQRLANQRAARQAKQNRDISGNEAKENISKNLNKFDNKYGISIINILKNKFGIDFIEMLNSLYEQGEITEEQVNSIMYDINSESTRSDVVNRINAIYDMARKMNPQKLDMANEKLRRYKILCQKLAECGLNNVTTDGDYVIFQCPNKLIDNVRGIFYFRDSEGNEVANNALNGKSLAQVNSFIMDKCEESGKDWIWKDFNDYFNKCNLSIKMALERAGFMVDYQEKPCYTLENEQFGKVCIRYHIKEGSESGMANELVRQQHANTQKILRMSPKDYSPYAYNSDDNAPLSGEYLNHNLGY